MIDVCLILEGTYPYVAGGVSTWIHQLVTAMREIRFSILYISTFPNPTRQFKYKVPPNVIDIQDLYLHEYDLDPTPSSARRRRSAYAELGPLHEDLLQGKWDAFERMLPLLRDPDKRITAQDIFHSLESWELLSCAYEKHGQNVSFLHFFWTTRSIYLPLYKTLTVPIPKARLYHTVSTGYAGLVAAIAKLRRDKYMLLTEHGVYTHERLLEISQASWIHTPGADRFRIQRELPYFKRFWLGLFKALGGITYRYADQIVTLYEGNRTREILDGADPAKIAIIPNGINLEKFRKLTRVPRTGRATTVAFIGRVVSIKDVKTFLQAAKIVLGSMPEVRFELLGPTDEEAEYMDECRQMLAGLGIEKSVHFLGKVELTEHLPRIDLVVLTSLSEAQPFVILEANAAGIPVVATNVGACRELTDGRLPADRKLGASGTITDVAAPEQTAAAICDLLSDRRKYERFVQAGRTRVSEYYDEIDLIIRYRNLYEQNMR